MDGDRIIEFVLWMLSLILAIVFFYNGVSKILGYPLQVDQFQSLGIPIKLLMVVGLFECLGALLLTIPRLALFGGTILGLIMLSSAGLHLAHDNIFPAFRAIVIVLMLGGICYLRFTRQHAQE